MLSQWLARLETHLPEENWACWCFTRQGRYQLRKRVVDSGLLCSGSVSDYKDRSMRKNAAADYIKNEGKKLLQFLASEKERLEEPAGREEAPIPSVEFMVSGDIESGEMEEQLVGLTLEQDRADEDSEILRDGEGFCAELAAEGNLHRRFNERLDANRAKALSDLVNLDVYHNAYAKALPVVTMYVTALSQDASDDYSMKLFDRWLYGDVPPRELEWDSEYDMWANFCKYDELRPLALAALRLVSVGASEASVERLISAHRYLVHDRMTKLSAKVLLARLRLRARTVTENRRTPT